MSKSLKNRRGASGQAIILVALSMIGLIAALALAVDGGRLFDLRRVDQNDVDADVDAVGAKIALTVGDLGDLNTLAKSVVQDPTATFTVNKTDYPQYGYSYYDTYGTVSRCIPAGFAQVIGIMQICADASAVDRTRIPMYAASNFGVIATSTTCQNAASSSGADLQSTANWWSNNDVSFTNSPRATQNGMVYDVTGSNNPNTAMSPSVGNPMQVSQPVQFPAVDVSIYAPGSQFANLATGAGLYTYSSANLSIGGTNPNGAPNQVSGLYFSDGDIQLNNVYGTATFAARGSIKFSGNSGSLTPYTSNGALLISAQAASSCGQSGISISTSTFSFSGMIMSNSGINWSDSGGSSFRGLLLGYTVHIASGHTMLAGNPDYYPFGKPNWALVK